MARMNIRDALTSALNVTGIQILHPYDHHPGIVDMYETNVVTTALEALGFERRHARKTARVCTGCSRVRLIQALKRLRYDES